MWMSTPTADAITRPRIAVALVSAVAAISVGYYAYQTRRALDALDADAVQASSLHRSNAVRRNRQPRNDVDSSSSSSDAPGDENVDTTGHASLQPIVTAAVDAETVADSGLEDWDNDVAGFHLGQRAGHNIVNLLFRVSEDNARRNGCVHKGCLCNSCGMVPIRGVRYRCANCADFDLCETCEASGVHTKTHIFYKIRVPAPPFASRQMQPVWYTGDPDSCRRTLPRSLITKLSRVSGFERPELEAFWEQWTFMANSELREDPDELELVMDRKTFERCLVPTGGSKHAEPNLIHDRMFSFYDSNNDGFIDFTEFLKGLSYRKRKDKLNKVFEGYDIDGDGFVDRKDFLRMFRAYYVLYKQMHKDILDGMQDQLLASTEVRQLIASRQPLSSLFGREGRVPAGDGSLRFEGKTFHRDGSVDVAEGYRDAVAEDKGDTATREEILTSLFACETDQRSRRQFVTGDEGDNHWRVVRRLSGNENNNNSAYWVSLLDPPTSLEELPDIILGNRNLQDEESSEDQPEGDDPEGDPIDEAETRQESYTGPLPTDSEARARIIAHNRRQIPKMEKRRRDMARAQLHERWKRRQFYLDEEEGGVAPDDWDDDEDILSYWRDVMDKSRAAEKRPQSAHSSASRSSSAGGPGDSANEEPKSTRSDSTGSRAQRSEPRFPRAEQDAGKEVLYQVTQQAFNELLDTLFKSAEELATDAAQTKEARDKYREQLDKLELTNDKPLEDKSLEELMEDIGATFEAPRNGIDLDGAEHVLEDEEEETTGPANEEAEDELRDPTMPQFRPNSHSGPDAHPNRPAAESSPTPMMMRHWKKLDLAEAQAKERGGWGKLSFTEFEQIYRSQEDQGNRLDYLGSWIDFCIP